MRLILNCDMRFITVLVAVFFSKSNLYSQVLNTENLFFKEDTLMDKKSATKYTGEFTDYYPGKVRTVGSYTNGLKNGKFIYYSKYSSPNKNSRIIDSTVNYKDGIRHGIKEIYFTHLASNHVAARIPFVNNRVNGIGYYWHPSMQLDYTIEFKDDSALNEVKYHIDNSILSLDVRVKEIPNSITTGKNLPDSLTLEIIALSRNDTSSLESSFCEVMSNYKVKSFVLKRHTRFQFCQGNKFQSYILTFGNKKDDGNLFIRNIVFEDKYNLEYTIPYIEITLK